MFGAIKSVRHRLSAGRRRIGRTVQRATLGSKVPSVIGDDCWAGEFYKYLDSPYLSPLVGVYVVPPGHLQIVASPREMLTQPLRFIKSEKPFPVATLGGVELWFMQYKDEDEAGQKWQRRLERVRWENLLIKIDFGKSGYTAKSIEQWNSLRPAPSIALQKEKLDGVWNGIVVQDWIDNGSKIFPRSINHFCPYRLVLEGTISNKNHWLTRYRRVIVD